MGLYGENVWESILMELDLLWSLNISPRTFKPSWMPLNPSASEEPLDHEENFPFLPLFFVPRTIGLPWHLTSRIQGGLAGFPPGLVAVLDKVPHQKVVECRHSPHSGHLDERHRVSTSATQGFAIPLSTTGG